MPFAIEGKRFSRDDRTTARQQSIQLQTHQMMRPKRSHRVPKNQPAAPTIKLNRRVSLRRRENQLIAMLEALNRCFGQFV
jgi:hypothetical protein